MAYQVNVDVVLRREKLSEVDLQPLALCVRRDQNYAKVFASFRPQTALCMKLYHL